MAHFSLILCLSLEKQGVFGMQDKVDIYILTNDLHGSGIVLRQRDNQNAVVVVIHLLNLC